jgi:hypothetical protein
VILIDLYRVNFDRTAHPPEFSMEFISFCDVCTRSIEQIIAGKYITRLLVECSVCHDKCFFDLQSMIMDVVETVWKYEPDDVEKVKEAMKVFIHD